VAYRDVRPKNNIVPASHGRSSTCSYVPDSVIHLNARSIARWVSNELEDWHFYSGTSCRLDVLKTVVVGAVGRRRGLSDGRLRYRLTTTNERRWPELPTPLGRDGNVKWWTHPDAVENRSWSARSRPSWWSFRHSFWRQSRVCRAFLMEFNSVKQSSLSRPVGWVRRAIPVGIKEKRKEFRIGTASILPPDWPDETKFEDNSGLAVVL